MHRSTIAFPLEVFSVSGKYLKTIMKITLKPNHPLSLYKAMSAKEKLYAKPRSSIAFGFPHTSTSSQEKEKKDHEKTAYVCCAALQTQPTFALVLLFTFFRSFVCANWTATSILLIGMKLDFLCVVFVCLCLCIAFPAVVVFQTKQQKNHLPTYTFTHALLHSAMPCSNAYTWSERKVSSRYFFVPICICGLVALLCTVYSVVSPFWWVFVVASSLFSVAVQCTLVCNFHCRILNLLFIERALEINGEFSFFCCELFST